MKTLYQLLLKKQMNHILPVFGFAPADAWKSEKKYPVPDEFFPENIFPSAKTVIVIGVPVNLPILETTPSVYYNEHYKTLNSFLDQEALLISQFLNEENMPSMPISRDGYAGISALVKNPAAAFSHKHAAYHAGLGTFGRNNTILTKRYGPRIRFTTVLTAATFDELGIPQKVSKGIKSNQKPEANLCIECMLCVRHCPAGAICGDKKMPYPLSKIDKQKCTAQSEKLAARGISPCGICIKVCPIGEDRNKFRRTDLSVYNYEKDNSSSNKENAPAEEMSQKTAEKIKLIQSWDHIRKYGQK
ncbi:epoxyqueuosine reductase [Methanolapillus millepedarum]|uniref:Epoxyqueuosine reductase n=1 Tax=Methanolapillus millepedarum TaxID=3028296 RepID=A0AA96V2C2_9EURY|nr:Epoxyqueuosine reductase [Methanosarcinaceae archaeon Ac7]